MSADLRAELEAIQKRATSQVYQQVARMLRRAFDRAGTAETGETTNA